MFKFQLGDKVKCRVTGFAGIVFARTEWYNGCIRYVVMSSKLHENKTLDETFDESQLALVTAEAVKPVVKANRTGGPYPNVTQRSTPR